MTEFTVLIPARLHSTRLKEKMLFEVGGKPIIQWTWENACRSGARYVVIATDDMRIADAANDFGATVILTRDHKSGTDRIAEAGSTLNLLDTDVVVNVQGDEPLMSCLNINQIASVIHGGVDYATLKTKILNSVDHITESVVKVVTDNNSNAIYFSRQNIPTNFRHIGIYGYTWKSLKQFVDWKQGECELDESLEQMRIIENCKSIKVIEAIKPTIGGIDTETDLHVFINEVAKWNQ